LEVKQHLPPVYLTFFEEKNECSGLFKKFLNKRSQNQPENAMAKKEQLLTFLWA